jgi:hypothetical protein
MAYDEQRRQVVLFGNPGYGRPDHAVTWTWDGTDWAEADRTGFFMADAMVYDGKLGSVVAFNFIRLQSWQWNGSVWSGPASGGPLPPRSGEAVAYDPVSGAVVVFGGQGAFPNAILGDTWTWDGSQWTQQHPAASPTPRHLALMAYDPSSKKLLLFGGLTSAGWSTETWSWDGSTWTQLSPRASPPATGYVSAADSQTGAPIVIGQTPISSASPSTVDMAPLQTWEQWCWTGTTWRAQVAGVHPNRPPTASAYDKNSRETVTVYATGSGEPITTWILG